MPHNEILHPHSIRSKYDGAVSPCSRASSSSMVAIEEMVYNQTPMFNRNAKGSPVQNPIQDGNAANDDSTAQWR
ncbi:hypothetical protein cgR_2374 [Corynebacterium glutamicum R]|uniref:Uncharacterized protein n=1 Tax=Corynebacterium glutamicum (strain R) TaxID=340322 RepID=A0AB72VCS8_CORGB|nr:hypothetical protein cgR_2374 [Corynebacterium glutamicum R]